MFMMLGFGLFMAPILILGYIGVKKLINEIGIKAVITLFFSFPFYLGSIFVLFRRLMQEFENILNHETNSSLWEFSTFEGVTLMVWVGLSILAFVFAKMYRNKLLEG